MLSSHSIYQPQVVAALSQFSSLLSSARSGTNTRSYRRVTTQRHARKVTADKEKDNKSSEVHNINVNELLQLPEQINIEELSPLITCINKKHVPSHVSAETFFENKSGFSERMLHQQSEERIIKEQVLKIMGSKPFQNFLQVSVKNLFHQQIRGFKTKRLASVGLGSSKRTGLDADLKTLGEQLQEKWDFGSKTKLGKLSSGEKLDELLTQSKDNKDMQKMIKVSFAEGYLAKDKVAPKLTFMQSLSNKVGAVLTFILFLFLLRAFFSVSVGMGSGVPGLSILKQDVYEVMPEDVHVTFDDVKGIDTAKDELREVVDYLKEPEKYTALGAKLPKGVLLVGPPGIGKTLLARAVAGEAGVPFFSCSGSEFDEMFVGLGAKRIRELFKNAKSRGSCVIFIDEIDSVGAKRTSTEMHPYANQTINQLLSEMDGFSQNENIIVLGATNRVDQLDKALRRKGRFDVEVRVFPPDLKGRKEIIDLYLSKVKADPKINIEGLAKGTTGFTGADIQNLVNTAALKAALDKSDVVTDEHLYWARDKVLMGPENKNKIPDEKVNWNTAVHEAGHTIVAYYTKEATPLHKVTIQPRGLSLGHTSFIPDKEEFNETKAGLLAQMDVAMGGRVAEELLFGMDNVTTGAMSDFTQATKIASLMVTKFGMSEKIGVRVFDTDAQDAGLSFVKINNFSESVNREIDAEIKRLLQESYERAKRIITSHQDKHKRLANELMKYETLTKEEIKSVMDGKPINRKS